MSDEAFRIDTDEKAEWALRKIKEREAEYERIRALGLAEIDRVSKTIEQEKERCDKDTAFFRAALDGYMDTVKCRETKTGQKKYRLLSGTLVRKPMTVTFARDDDVLADYLMRNGRTDLIRTKVAPLWGEYKKQVVVREGQVIDSETGEVVEGVVAQQTPGGFSVEWKEETA